MRLPSVKRRVALDTLLLCKKDIKTRKWGDTSDALETLLSGMRKSILMKGKKRKEKKRSTGPDEIKSRTRH